MNIELLTALVTFAFVASVTPGPNNLMLMASGANFGVLRTLPHFFGISLGFGVMVVLVGVGLIQVFEAYPLSYEVLRWFSIAYLTWLAWKIATASGTGATRAGGRPLSWVQAALFQWVNPKAWAFALTAITAYAPSQSLVAVGMIAFILVVVNMPSIFVWVVLGSRMQDWLGDGSRLRAFNRVMAALLLMSLYPVAFGQPG
ncbi:MAG: LysE family translocator [Gammaproteobacteria bacterium]|nr:LysE family translocator [Gammaproteobacteria bacterium]